MALTTNVARFHREVFPKVRYDGMLEQYRINIGDYILLNLTKRQFGVLERICQKNNIFLEKIPKILSVPESSELFTKFQELKRELENDLDYQTKQTIEAQIKQIRNKLFEGHLKLLYIALYKNIPNLEESIYKEDILQSAYICLLNHIDIYNPQVTNKSFRQFFWDYTANNIIKAAIYIQNNSVNVDYNVMLNAKRKLEQPDLIAPEELSQSTRLETHRINELMTLEQILNASSLEELVSKEELSQDLLDNSQEEQTYLAIFKELLILIIETLPNQMQKDIVIKRYGLDGEEPKKFEQITEVLGLSNRQRVQQINNDALEHLQNSTRAKYIKELVQGYSPICLSKELEILPIDEESIDYEKLEIYLMKRIPKEELLELIMELDIKYRGLLLSLFELTEEKYTSKEEIYQKNGINYKKYLELKQKGLFHLRTQIKYKYVINNPNENINSVLDYLMYNYLSKGRSKIKKQNARR